MKAYLLQTFDTGWTQGLSLVRASDSAEIAHDGGEPEDRNFARDFAPVVEELNRLALENKKLREQRDDRTLELLAEMQKLRVRLELLAAEDAGQLRMLT